MLAFLFSVFSALCATCANASAKKLKQPSGIAVETSLKKPSSALDEDIIFYVTVFWTGKANRYNVSFPSILSLHNLKMVGSSSESFSESTDRGMTFKKFFTLRFRARHQKTAEIGQVTVEYQDNTSHEKSTLSASGASIDILPPVKDRYRTVFYVSSIVGAAITICLLVFFCLGLLRKRNLKKTKEQEPPLPTVEESVKEKLECFVSPVSSAEQKEFFTKICRLLKKYLLDKYDIKPEETTEKIDKLLTEMAFPHELKTRIDKILRICDKVMFAQYVSSKSEQEQVLKAFKHILDNPTTVERNNREVQKEDKNWQVNTLSKLK